MPGCLFAGLPQADITKLPPPAESQVDFARDIKPILDNSCVRCHGPDRQRSKFRLDNSDSALKGGAQGVDIIPGDSAHSRLIHYVSRLVPEMEMPPIDKGDLLTSKQVALLRAWIDQGVAWGAAKSTNEISASLSTMFGATGLSGNVHKFREQLWQQSGVTGGVSDFSLIEKPRPDTELSITGHALLDDYLVSLKAEKKDLGFFHAGYSEYRKYFDDTGGFVDGLKNAPSLDDDLHLDIGKAWAEVGLTLPNWPRFVLGYEYDYRTGKQATTDWGAYGAGAAARNIAPNEQDLKEGTHIIRFDFQADIKDVTVEDQFQGEIYSLETVRTNRYAAFSAGASARPPIGFSSEDVAEGTHYFEGANTFHLERKFTDWLMASAGYLYSKLNADSSFSLDTHSLPGFRAVAEEMWNVPKITLERESHVVNVNTLLGAFKGLTISTGVQGEVTREDGFGAGLLNQGPPFTPNPASLYSDYNLSSIEGSTGLRYSAIPFTALFADAHVEEQRIGQTDQLSDAVNVDKGDLTQNTQFKSQWTDFRAGFNTSPWQSVSLTADYHRNDDQSWYNSDPLLQPPGFHDAYPTFIQARNVLTEEVEARLTLRVTARFKTAFSYQYRTTGYSETTASFADSGVVASPGGTLESGRDRGNIYSFNVNFTPTPRLNLSATFSYERSVAQTANAGSPDIVPCRGDVYSAIGDAVYSVSASTDVFAGISFAAANYSQLQTSAPVPLGTDYTEANVQAGIVHRFTKTLSSKLQYRYSSYEDPSVNGAADFFAHSVFVTLTYTMD